MPTLDLVEALQFASEIRLQFLSGARGAEGRGLAYPRADLAADISRSAFRLARWAGALRRLRSWKLQEPKVERREHQDDPDVHHQPLPEPVPEEQDVHADHDGYQREHVKCDGCLSSHPSFLLRAAHRHHPSAGTPHPTH